MSNLIFSDENSENLWNEINSVKGKSGDALYLLGCYCQQLEHKVEGLSKQIAELRDEIYCRDRPWTD